MSDLSNRLVVLADQVAKLTLQDMADPTAMNKPAGNTVIQQYAFSDVEVIQMTEFEKAIICVALYWFNMDVVEMAGLNRCAPGAATSLLWNEQHTKSAKSYPPNDSYLFGGAIEMMWRTCNRFRMGLSAGSSGRWNAWCATFTSFVWLEALQLLGQSTNTNLTNVIKGSQARVKTNINDQNPDTNSFIGRLIALTKTSAVSQTPCNGSFFFRKSYGGGGHNHCGVVIKVIKDDNGEVTHFYTVEGNTERHDGQAGIALLKYSAADINKSGFPMYFVCLSELGVQGNYTAYLGLSCFEKEKKITCPPDSELVEGKCVKKIICPPDTELIDGKCVKKVLEGKCPEGFELIGDKCIGKGQCPEGFELIGDKCIGKGQCPPDHVMINGKCEKQVVNDCPPGYARNANGECVKNAPPEKTNCCPDAMYLPNIMQMHPITALFPEMNEVSMIHQDIMADIIGYEFDDEDRKAASHGMAMGLANPMMDTGQPTGFGLFKGVKAHKKSDGQTHYNVFCIGYVGNANFISAAAQGVFGPIDANDLPRPNGHVGDIQPFDFARLVTDPSREWDNKGMKSDEMATYWMARQPFKEKFLLFRSEKGNSGDDKNKISKGLWEHYTGSGIPTNYSAMGNDGFGRYLFVQMDNDGQFYKNGQINNEDTWLSLPLVKTMIKDYTQMDELQTGVKHFKGNPMVGSKDLNGGNKGFLRQGREDKFSDTLDSYAENGIGMSLSTLLKYLDETQHNEIVIIALAGARVPSKPSVFTSDFWQVFQIASLVLNVIPGIGNVASAAVQAGIKASLKVAEQVFKMAEGIEQMVGGKGLNFGAMQNILTGAYKCACMISPPQIKEIETVGKDGKKYSAFEMVSGTGFPGFVNGIGNTIDKFTAEKIGISSADFERWGKILEGYWQSFQNSKYGGSTIDIAKTVGEPLLQFYGILNENNTVDWNSASVNKFLRATTGMTSDDYQNYYTMIQSGTGAGKAAWQKTMQGILNRPSDTNDVHKLMSYVENIKNVQFVNAMTTFFNGGASAATKLWTMQRETGSNDMTNSSLIREALLRVSSGSVIGALPALTSAMGMGLSLKQGDSSGTGFVLNKYGADAIFGAIKTAVGIPADAMEMKGLIASAVLKDAGLQEGDDDTNTKIILPSYMSPEIKDCIACSFIYDKRNVQICEEGQTYNWVSGKCERSMYHGFDVADCYNPCDDRIALPEGTRLPTSIVECEGGYYYNTDYCTNNVLKNAITQTMEQYNSSGDNANSAIGAGMLAMATGLLDGEPCIPNNDCLKTHKNYRNAVYTANGWYVWSGDGVGTYPENRWLKGENLATCTFSLAPCKGEGGGNCTCTNAGCSCDDIKQFGDDNTAYILAKLEEMTKLLPKSKDSKNLQKELRTFRERLGDKKVYVKLGDGTYNDGTMEILYYIDQLRQVIELMQFCHREELAEEIIALIERISAEMDANKGKVYAVGTDETTYLNSEFYINSINDLIVMIEKARKALEECTCEETFLPHGDIYYNSDKETITKEEIQKIIKEALKEMEPPKVKCCCGKVNCPECKGEQCKDYDNQFQEIKELIRELKNTPHNVKCCCGKVNCPDCKEGEQCKDYTAEFSKLAELISNIKADGVDVKDYTRELNEIKQLIEAKNYTAEFAELRQAIEELKKAPLNVKCCCGKVNCPECKGEQCKDYTAEFIRLNRRLDELHFEAGKDYEREFTELKQLISMLKTQSERDYSSEFAALKTLISRLQTNTNTSTERDYSSEFAELKMLVSRLQNNTSTERDYSSEFAALKTLISRLQTNANTSTERDYSSEFSELRQLVERIERTNNINTQIITEQIRTSMSELVSNIDRYRNEVYRIVQSVQCKECDNSQILQEIRNVQNQFSSVERQAYSCDDTNVISTLERMRQDIVNRINSIQVSRDTNVSREVIQQLLMLRNDINTRTNNAIQNKYRTRTGYHEECGCPEEVIQTEQKRIKYRNNI